MGSTCNYAQVQAGEGCFALARSCSITQDQLQQYNTAANFCSSLQPGQYVCCSPGDHPDFAPKPNANGTCYVYITQAGDSCSAVAAAHQTTVDNITSFNSQTWGWSGCSGLQVEQRICLSEGTPPFPSPVQGAVCGPQVSIRLYNLL